MIIEISKSWVDKFIQDAKHFSTRSKDPSKKIGSVAVGKHNQILSTGYNGFPRGIEDSVERLNDRETKYKYVVHSEMNLIYNSCLNGVSLDGASLFIYGLPVCSECAKAIIQVGITDVYYMTSGHVSDIWIKSNEFTKELFNGLVNYHYLGHDTSP